MQGLAWLDEQLLGVLVGSIRIDVWPHNNPDTSQAGPFEPCTKLVLDHSGAFGSYLAYSVCVRLVISRHVKDPKIYLLRCDSSKILAVQVTENPCPEYATLLLGSLYLRSSIECCTRYATSSCLTAWLVVLHIKQHLQREPPITPAPDVSGCSASRLLVPPVTAGTSQCFHAASRGVTGVLAFSKASTVALTASGRLWSANGKPLKTSAASVLIPLI